MTPALPSMKRTEKSESLLSFLPHSTTFVKKVAHKSAREGSWVAFLLSLGNPFPPPSDEEEARKEKGANSSTAKTPCGCEKVSIPSLLPYAR